MPARILLIMTGLSTLGIAATPEPVTGPTWRHLAFAISCVVTTAVWPVFVARRPPAPSWIMSVTGCAMVTAVFTGLSCWLLIAAQHGGGDLGFVERLTAAVQGLFPLIVAVAVRQAAARSAGGQRPRGWVAGNFRAPARGVRPCDEARPTGYGPDRGTVTPSAPAAGARSDLVKTSPV